MIKRRDVFLCGWLVLAAYAALGDGAGTHKGFASEDASATPKPTRSPVVTPTLVPTPAPLPAAAFASCPVSLPNLSESPDEYYISAASGYGNPEGTMFIGLWPGGKVIFHPGGPDALSADGSLSMKFWFYRTIPGEVVIEGRRLDEPGSAAHLATLRGPADGYGETGFHPAGLRFPGQGCWEVTARIGDARMTFITLVVWIPFKLFRSGWFPDRVMVDSDFDLTGYPWSFQYVYRYADGGELTVGTAQSVWDDSQSYPDSAQHQFASRGGVATCVQGNWDGEDWNPEADTGELTWSDQALHYRIRQVNLGLSCQNLLSMAVGPD